MTKTAVKALEGMTFGADPELFIIDEEGNGVCPDGYIPGTKEEPYKVPGGAIQMDGMAAEFNIDPVTCYEDFRDNVKTVLKSLETFLPPKTKLSAQSSIIFSEKVWEEAPSECKVLGCSPDFNAWTQSINPPPKRREIHPRFCSAGGHVHFGWTSDADPSDNDYSSSCLKLVKQLDWYTGAWSSKFNKNDMRRLLYGKLGSMRFKEYGVEYRAPSNFWLVNDKRMLAFWNRIQSAIHDLNCEYYLPDETEIMLGETTNTSFIECVNNNEPVPNYIKQNFSHLF